MTAGIADLGEAGARSVISAVAAFAAFSPDNDPYGEHDCAVLTVDDRCVIFKIDYYDLDTQGGSEDPGNPHVTRRVMTIMLAEEY